MRERDRNESPPTVAVHDSKVTTVQADSRSNTGHALVSGNWMGATTATTADGVTYAAVTFDVKISYRPCLLVPARGAGMKGATVRVWLRRGKRRGIGSRIKAIPG
jgi:hypothetical protein